MNADCRLQIADCRNELRTAVTSAIRNLQSAICNLQFSDVEPDMHDVAVGDDVLLPLHLQLAGFLHRMFGPVLDEHRVRNHLGPDEPSLQVRVDASRRLTSSRSTPDRPRPDFILTDREERDEVEQAIGRANETRQRRFGETEVVEERLLLVRREAGNFRLNRKSVV